MFALKQIIPLDFFPNYNVIINYTPIPYLIKFPVDIAMAQDFNINIWIELFNWFNLVFCDAFISSILYNLE